MGPTPVYGARAEKPLQNADFAMKQTNICRLSGDIIKTLIRLLAPLTLLSPIHTADADETKLFCRVASASAVCIGL